MENNPPDPFCGSREDIAQFLIWDYLQRIDRVAWIKNINEKSFSEGLGLHVKKYEKIKNFLAPLDRFFLKVLIFRRKKSRKTILFEESKYYPIVLRARKKFNVGFVAQGQKDRLFALSRLMGYIQTNDIDRLVLSYLKDKKPKFLRDLVEKTKEKLKAAEPDYIALSYDVFPIQRAIILAAKKMGITTLVVQRSMYNPFVEYTDFKAADYALVWGNYFKDFCVKHQKKRPENVYVLGYPSPIVKYDLKKRRAGDIGVCYLGQDFQKYNSDFFPIKINTLNSILKICKKLGMRFIYRPHYAESRSFLRKHLPEAPFTGKGESLERTFNNSDIFISFYSTTLPEASMRGKIALQFMDYPIPAENFEELGACDRCFENINQLENFLETVSKSSDLSQFKKEFNNDYIETRYDPASRFLEIVNDIGSI